MGRCSTEEEYFGMKVPHVATEWFDSRTPLRTTTRKARLFLCACCRRVWDWLGPDVNREAVEAAERAADKLLRVKDLEKFAKATVRMPTPLRKAPFAELNPAHDAAWPFAWVPWHWPFLSRLFISPRRSLSRLIFPARE